MAENDQFGSERVEWRVCLLKSSRQFGQSAPAATQVEGHGHKGRPPPSRSSEYLVRLKDVWAGAYRTLLPALDPREHASTVKVSLARYSAIIDRVCDGYRGVYITAYCIYLEYRL
jgi:hypothetical protein